MRAFLFCLLHVQHFFPARVQHSFDCVTLLACAGARWNAHVQQSLAFRALFCLAALAKSFGFFSLALDFWFYLHAPI
jgi:hypothetical protein